MTNSTKRTSYFHYFGWWISIGYGLIISVIYLSLMAKPPEIFEFSSADKLKHLLAYGVLMGWFTQLYTAKQRQLILALAFSLLGGAIEFAQGWSGYRYYDMADMVANILGVLLGWWFSNGALSGNLLRVDLAVSKWLR